MGDPPEPARDSPTRSVMPRGARRWAFRPVPVLLAVVAVCVLPLAAGAERLLLVGLPGGLPLGTLLAALAFVAGAAVPVVASRPGSALRWVGGAALVAAVAWLPAGVYLSGNAALHFVDDAADAERYWMLTAGLGACVLGTLLWASAAARRSRPGRPHPG